VLCLGSIPCLLLMVVRLFDFESVSERAGPRAEAAAEW